MHNWLAFVALLALVVVARLLIRLWIARELRAGRISDRRASLAFAATWAATLLVALPWVISNWPILIGVSVIGFVLYFAVVAYLLRFIRTGQT